MPINISNVLDYAVTFGVNPNMLILLIVFSGLVRSKKATKNITSILDALARVVEAWNRHRK